MRTFRPKSGPFELQLRFTCQEIDRLCLEALSAEKLLPETPGPVRIERFVERHFNCQISFEDIGPGILGCTVFNPDGSIRIVAISSRIEDGTSAGERRLRATIAHEAGHGLMHPSLFLVSMDQGTLDFGSTKRENVDFSERRILCRDHDIREGAPAKRTYDGRWWEWQANRAIGSLLLPNHLVARAMDHLLVHSPVTGLPSLPTSARTHAVGVLAECFEVNPVVARIKLDELFPEGDGQMSF